MSLRLALLPLSGLLFAAGCAMPTSPSASADPASTVVAVLQPTRGNTASGTVWFSQDGAQVLVRGRVSGLAPSKEHGFHIHEKGDCTSGDGMSSGGHLNPDGKPHGPQEREHHAGDLPALKADTNGNAVVRARVAGNALGGGAGAFAGKALIVHVSPDDYTTQPTGNSGARIACGVISTTPGRDAAGNPMPVPKEL
jgi:Cu-Zn family superoxide dismutase